MVHGMAHGLRSTGAWSCQVRKSGLLLGLIALHGRVELP